MTTIHAAPIKDTTTKTSTSGVQVIEQEYLNQILSTDSDEDVYFGRTWSDLFDEAQQDLKAALMMVSSSSDDHVIEMTILTRTKEQMTESYPLDDNNDEDDMDFMSDTWFDYHFICTYITHLYTILHCSTEYPFVVTCTSIYTLCIYHDPFW